ncbi:MAG: hypothetical protein ABI740_08285 [Alphaproteobacteria bacterium]
MGDLGGRFIHQEDARGWVRSAFESLGQDGRFRFDARRAPDTVALTVQVDLVQAYIRSSSTAKNATIVVRVRYGFGDRPAEEKSFRGQVSQINWAGLDTEAQDALNQALKEAVAAVDDDIIARCGRDQPQLAV